MLPLGGMYIFQTRNIMARIAEQLPYQRKICFYDEQIMAFQREDYRCTKEGTMDKLKKNWNLSRLQQKKTQ
jgi:hypothetical protein